MINIRNVSKSFANQRVLDGIDLTVNKGETVALLGPSGSGKTTLLRCLNGLETFDEGSMDVDGVELLPKGSPDYKANAIQLVRLRCGFVFQQYHLFPHLSVLSNITLAPVKVKRVAPEVARTKGLELLERVGLKQKADHKPARLSGGEQQRVAIVRALALEPSYLLYDEPTSALDPHRAQEMWSIMQDLAQQGQTQIVVTHQIELTRHIACRVVRMNQGRIEAAE